MDSRCFSCGHHLSPLYPWWNEEDRDGKVYWICLFCKDQKEAEIEAAKQREEEEKGAEEGKEKK